MVNFNSCFLAAFFLLFSLCGLNTARSDLVFTEMFTPDTTDIGSDIEGLVGATLSFSFTSESGPTYVDVLGLVGVTSSVSSVTISGSSVAANNGTFTTIDYGPTSSLSGGAGFTRANITVIGGGEFSRPAIILPSTGNRLVINTSAYSGGNNVAVGNTIDAIDWGTNSIGTSNIGVFSAGNGSILMTDNVVPSTLTVVNAIPEPGAFSLMSIGLLGLLSGRRRQ